MILIIRKSERQQINLLNPVTPIKKYLRKSLLFIQDGQFKKNGINQSARNWQEFAETAVKDNQIL